MLLDPVYMWTPINSHHQLMRTPTNTLSEKKKELTRQRDSIYLFIYLSSDPSCEFSVLCCLADAFPRSQKQPQVSTKTTLYELQDFLEFSTLHHLLIFLKST